MARKLLIVGAGLTGLTAAYLAAKEGWQVTVLEESAKAGGLLNTFAVGKSRLEVFYHHHFRHDLELMWLLKELGIADKLVFHPSTMGVYREGKLYDFNGPRDLIKFTPLGWPDKIRFGLSSLYLAICASWQKNENISAYDWFAKYAGKATSEALWQPMLKIKFGDYARQVPLAWMIGRLKQRVTSRKGAQEMLGYMEGSLQTLLDAMLARLKELGVEILTSTPVIALNGAAGKITSVRSAKGEHVADAVLVTTPTPTLAPLVRELDAAYADKLEEIKYFGALCVVVEHTRALSNTYWLNVADEGFPFGGVIEHTNLIPATHYQGRHITYLSRYFEITNPLASQPEAEVKAAFIAALKRLYPTLTDAEISAVHLFRSHTAATVCDLNFSKKVPTFRSPIEGLYVASMCHVYPDERSCNNCVRVAANALKQIGVKLPAIPQSPTLAGRLGFGACVG